MPTIEVQVPRLHRAQRRTDAEARRFSLWACGRRFGKSILSRRRLLRVCASGKPVAYFCPTYPMMSEYWRDTVAEWFPLIESINQQEKRLQLRGGGVLELWSLSNADVARGRKYAHIAIDEAAMVRNLKDAWQRAIRPTLTDYAGSADFYSTPRGYDDFHDLWQRGQDPERTEWASWQMPTSANPHIDAAEIEAARGELTELSFSQEYLAEFVRFGGGGMFPRHAWGVPLPVSPASVAARVRYWDKAGADEGKGDYTAGVLMARLHDGSFVVEDVQRFQLQAAQRNARIEQTAHADRAKFGNVAIWIEQPGAFGKEAAAAVVKMLAGFNVKADPVTGHSGSKSERAEPFAAQVQGGNVRLVAGLWNADYLDELEAFPSPNVHDDMVDASSGAFNKLARGGGEIGSF